MGTFEELPPIQFKYETENQTNRLGVNAELKCYFSRLKVFPNDDETIRRVIRKILDGKTEKTARIEAMAELTKGGE